MPDEKDTTTPAPPICKFQLASAGHAEIGSPEFAEDRTQVNSLNNKFMFDAALLTFMDGLMRSANHLAELQARSLQSIDENLSLTKKLNGQYFESANDRAKLDTSTRAQLLRLEADNAYVTRYDLSNPVATGAGDTLTSAAYTPNRAVDTASAGVGVSAEAVA